MAAATIESIMKDGLELIGLDCDAQSKMTSMRKSKYFHPTCGSSPLVILKMWQEHQTIADEDAHIDPGEMTMKHYLLGHNLISEYGTVAERMKLFKISKNTLCKWDSIAIGKIQALASTKIVWPDEWKEVSVNDNVSLNAAANAADNADGWKVFRLSVDGTHYRHEEPIDEFCRKNPQYYSFKFAEAAVNVEIGLDLFQSRCVWVNGPHPGGTHDITIFRMEDGLKEKMEETGNVMAVGDKGYRGEAALVSLHSSLDTDEVREFKKRALARHESYNKRLKNFNCLKHRFRHKLKNFRRFLLAVIVTVQFQMENGSPLFNSV